MTANFDRLRDVFLAAIEQHPPDRWDAYLDEACAGDPDLRRQAAALLAAHAGAGSVLGPASPGDTPTATRPADGPEAGALVAGRYKLLEVIGEGGMGTVWRAEQTEPVRRPVAVKVIKAGMDSRNVLARFEAERQALALMDHPNIAKVLDGGLTADGRPFFAMELVKGMPITKYCDDHRLTPKQRLELFVPVCQAIQHAHQKGVIHRDVKPSNVLVAPYDGRPVPKVIDFGVAKAAGVPLTDKTLFTGLGAVVGTPEYMSPEQAELNNRDIDTRTDVYSLGVLLYELLTGTTPLTKKRVKEAALLEVLRVIREEEPPRPSTRLTDSKDSLPAISAQRHMEPAKLTRLVRGELDWIVMRALEKDRNRRYESANALAVDVLRHLADERVEACPPSAGYRFRKFARRNKVVLAAATAGFLVVLLSVAGLIANNWLVAREKKKTETALETALAEKKRADENLARARKAVKEYLLKTSESPHLRAGDFQALRRELLTTAVPFLREFAQQAQDDPRLEAERGRAYADLAMLSQELGDHDRALADLDEAGQIFGRLADGWPDPEYRRELAGVHNTRGVVLDAMSRPDSADQAFRQAFDLLDRPGSDPGASVEDRHDLAVTCNNRGDLLGSLNRLEEAEALLRRAIALREGLLAERQTPAARGQLATSWLNLGAVLRVRRQPAKAEEAFRNAVQVVDASAGPAADSATQLRLQRAKAQALNNLAVVLREQGKKADAETAHRDSLEIKEKVAVRYPSVPLYRQELARGYSNLGVIRHDLGRPGPAQEAYEKSAGIYERLIADFPDVPGHAIELAGTYTNLGRLIGDRGQKDASLPWLAKAIQILEPAHRRDPRVAKVRETLVVSHWARAMTLAGLGRFEPALADWDRAIELDDGRHHISLRIKRASNRLQVKDHAGAAADARAVGESPESTAGDLYPAAAVSAMAARLAAGKPDLVEQYGAQAVGLLRRAAGKGYPNPERWKDDADLRDLRTRDDFRQLLSELAGKAPEVKKGK